MSHSLEPKSGDLPLQSEFDLERIYRESFVRQIDFHSVIESTNTRALELAATAQVFPQLVLAERQSAGRGRGSNRWWSGDGGLTLSLLLDAVEWGLPSSRWPMISLTTGVAVAKAISECITDADVRLKWPNDVYLNRRKVCGILLETASNRAGVIVIGIGLNVNNSFHTAPPDLQSIAVSLFDVSNRYFDRSSILIAVLQRLAECLSLLRADPSELADRWREICYLQSRTVQVHTRHGEAGPECLTGVCQGIDDDGALLLQTETGVVRCFSGIVARIL